MDGKSYCEQSCGELDAELGYQVTRLGSQSMQRWRGTGCTEDLNTGDGSDGMLEKIAIESVILPAAFRTEYSDGSCADEKCYFSFCPDGDNASRSQATVRDSVCVPFLDRCPFSRAFSRARLLILLT